MERVLQTLMIVDLYGTALWNILYLSPHSTHYNHYVVEQIV